ncbi:hypothetical protein AgCh_038208 [Apium graveolens]
MSKSAASMDVNKSKGSSFALSYSMLTKGNYTAWSMKMKVFMQAHGVWDVAVEPNDPKAEVDGKIDKIALAMMYQGISEDLLLSVVDEKNAKDSWEAIKTMSQAADRVKTARVQTLKAEFEALKIKYTDLLDEFYMKFNGLVTNIRALGEEVKESYVVKKLLRAVPTKFLKIASTLEQFGNLDTMTVEEVVGSLKAHEERLKGSSETSGEQLMLTEDEWLKREKDEAECRKPRRIKEQKQEAYLTRTDVEPVLLLAKHDKIIDERGIKPRLLGFNNEEKWESNVWYLENGASNHMSGQRTKFNDLNETITGKVKFGDVSTVEIKGKGSVSLKCKNGEEKIYHENGSGGEFMSKDFKTYYKYMRIERHFTAPYTPQQNGVVECRNRTVVEMARSFLKHANLPSSLWAEAVRHSIYILNQVPTRALTGKTPYEVLKESKPNLSYIRVFVCIAHMKIPGINTKKLDDRSVMVVNLGKEPGTKAYRLYDPVNKHVFVSRDVRFEGKYWRWEDQLQFKGNQQGYFEVSDLYDCEGDEVMDHGGAMTNDDSQTKVETSVHEQRHDAEISVDQYDDSHTPRRFIKLADLYDSTEMLEEEEEKEEELLLMGGHKVINLKWIYKLKKDADGKVVKHKARLVAKGYVQERGVDFDEIFAPVTLLETVRLLLALAVKNTWQVHHLDVKTTFLNGDLKEEVYVSQPDGFVKPGKEGYVYKLFKALYDLRQAPRA